MQIYYSTIGMQINLEKSSITYDAIMVDEQEYYVTLFPFNK